MLRHVWNVEGMLSGCESSGPVAEIVDVTIVLFVLNPFSYYLALEDRDLEAT